MMKSSQQWIDHFQHNLSQKRINWEQNPQINPEELARIRYGLRAWQKGETSDGSHLKKAAFNTPKRSTTLILLPLLNCLSRRNKNMGPTLAATLTESVKNACNLIGATTCFAKSAAFTTAWKPGR
ncbi:MAG: hypothetical protein U5L96_17500 [Owenweeksia sp.]|nr:hypothetical protein [Owenweeksia sp.]